jgi:hypothetical protein
MVSPLALRSEGLSHSDNNDDVDEDEDGDT